MRLNVRFTCAYVFISFLSLTTAAPYYNATTDRKQVVCVYQLSGQYGMLPRFLYYALIIFALFSKRPWLVGGALASALTYSGTTAVHAILLAAISKNSLFDIDAVGAFAICSAGSLAVMPILEFSSTLRNSQFRPIFGFYGTLVAIGSICAATAAIWRDYPVENACRSSENVLLTSAYQLADATFNCTYSCFSSHQLLRNPSEITVISKWQAFGRMEGVFVVAVSLTMIFGALLGVLSFGLTSKKSTEAELKATITGNKAHPRDIPKQRRAKAATRNRARKELNDGVYKPELNILTCCQVFFNPLAWPISIILCELYLLAQGGLPSNESAYAIGQWGPWVSVILALVASYIVHAYEPGWKERQKLLAEEKVAFDLRKLERNTQEVGVLQQPAVKIPRVSAAPVASATSSIQIDANSRIPQAQEENLAGVTRLGQRLDSDEYETIASSLGTGDQEDLSSHEGASLLVNLRKVKTELDLEAAYGNHRLNRIVERPTW